MPKPQYTDEQLDALDDADALRNHRERRLLAIEVKLEAAGLNLDDLIDLIEARREGSY